MKIFTGRVAPEPAILIAETPHATVTYPNWLETSQIDGADLVLSPIDSPDGFIPTLVLTSVADTAPLMDASTAAFHAARARHTGAYVLAVDLWHPTLDDSAPRGRRIIFVYRAENGQDVVVAEWVWATGTHHVHLSASCSPSQWTGYSPVFDGIAARLTLTADPADVAEAAGATGDAPLDAAVSARAGHPIESLDGIPAPTFLSAAPRVSTEALQALLTGATRARMGAAYGILARPDRGTSRARELQNSGWIDGEGRLTREGGAAGTALAANRPVVTVQTRRADRAALLVAYAGPRGVLVLHDPPLTDASATDGAARHAVVLDPDHVPTFVSAWLGLTPGWPVSEEDEQITVADLAAHVAAADPAVEPWTEVLLRSEDGQLADAISPSRGWLHLGPPVDGIHPLRAEPTAAVFDALAASVSRARA